MFFKSELICLHPSSWCLCVIRRGCWQQWLKCKGLFCSARSHQDFPQLPLSAPSVLMLLISYLVPSDHSTSKTTKQHRSDKTANLLQRTGLFLGTQMWQCMCVHEHVHVCGERIMLLEANTKVLCAALAGEQLWMWSSRAADDLCSMHQSFQSTGWGKCLLLS